VIPHLFDGKLPDFNLGTFNGASCDPACDSIGSDLRRTPDYSHVLNGRFKGGHITRHYGNPAQNIHAVQLELGQCTYMEEFEPFRYRPIWRSRRRWC
jgi:formiminoglutamase